MSQTVYANPYSFTGRRLDNETEMFHFRARIYDSRIGRFISRDPLSNVDGMSRYKGYFSANSTDPSGLWTWKLGPKGNVIAIAEEGDTLESLAAEGYDITGLKRKIKVIVKGTKIDVTSLLPDATIQILKREQGVSFTEEQLDAMKRHFEYDLEDLENKKTIKDKKLLRTLKSLMSAKPGKTSVGELAGGDNQSWLRGQFGSGNCYGFAAIYLGIIKVPNSKKLWHLQVVQAPIDKNVIASWKINPKTGFGFPETHSGVYFYAFKEGALKGLVGSRNETKSPVKGDLAVDLNLNSNNDLSHAGIVLGKSKGGLVYLIQKYSVSGRVGINTSKGKNWDNPKYFKGTSAK